MNISKKLFPLATVIILSLMLFCFTSIAKEGMAPQSFSDDEQYYYYLLDDYSSVKNEWKQVWNNWYYFGEDGKSKQNTWAEIGDKWYYFDNWSIMLHDTVTPDGYTVGSDGAWIESEPQITESVPTTEAVGPGIN